MWSFSRLFNCQSFVSVRIDILPRYCRYVSWILIESIHTSKATMTRVLALNFYGRIASCSRDLLLILEDSALGDFWVAIVSLTVARVFSSWNRLFTRHCCRWFTCASNCFGLFTSENKNRSQSKQKSSHFTEENSRNCWWIPVICIYANRPIAHGDEWTFGVVMRKPAFFVPHYFLTSCETFLDELQSTIASHHHSHVRTLFFSLLVFDSPFRLLHSYPC